MNESWIGRIAGGDDLAQNEMAAVIDSILAGGWAAEQIALLLTALRAKAETEAEIAGAAQAMRRHMTPIRSSRTGVVDTCGTGGDSSGTFNISTAAAIVTAAAGVPVAKHGNRRVTSRTGSADVLQQLGVSIEAPVERVEACLDELGLCFCFAPLLHGAMRQVAEVRRQLAVPTIFNLLGPLTNPAGAAFQVLGVGRAEVRERLAAALGRLGTERSLVVRGDDGLDEVTLAGSTTVIEVTTAGRREFRWTPADFGIEPQPLTSLVVDGPEASAAVIRRVLAGERGPARDIVVLNAAAAIWLAGRAPTPAAAAGVAAEALDSHAAQDLLARLAERSQGKSPT